jgi:hypothetical protein
MKPKLFQHANLSCAWAQAFVSVFDCSHHGPLVVNVTGFDGDLPYEHESLASALDEILRAKKNPVTIRQTAMTIFPFDTWERLGRPAVVPLAEYYLKHMLPRLKARNQKNSRGTYFQRMVSFTGTNGKSGDGSSIKIVNQLEHIVRIWNNHRAKGGSERESALQVGIFDPAKDHTGSPLQGFPCLQQVGFSVDAEDRLTVIGFYPSQYLVDRAYGNYRGLCHLGVFMAKEMGLQFGGLSCFVAHPLPGSVPKRELQELYRQARALVAETEALA